MVTPPSAKLDSGMPHHVPIFSRMAPHFLSMPKKQREGSSANQPWVRIKTLVQSTASLTPQVEVSLHACFATIPPHTCVVEKIRARLHYDETMK